MSVIDKFLPMVLDAEEEGVVSPILVHEKLTFIYIKHNNVYCILPRGWWVWFRVELRPELHEKV